MAYEEIVTSSKAAASGGTDLSLVTTGEKYSWNNKLATELSIYDKLVSYGFSRSISIKFKKGSVVDSGAADIRIPVKITFTNQYGHPATTLTVVMTPANCAPVGRVLQVGELEYSITVKSATNTSEHSTIYTFDLTNTSNWGTCDISVPGAFFQFVDISAVDTTGSNPSTLTIIRPGSEGIKLSNDSSFITAKKTGDFTWLSETTIDGNGYSAAKGVATAFAMNADSATYCTKLITRGHNNSGFSFEITENGHGNIYEIICYSPSSGHFWKAVVTKIDGIIYATAIAKSGEFDSALGFTFDTSSNPVVNLRWSSNAWMSYCVERLS